MSESIIDELAGRHAPEFTFTSKADVEWLHPWRVRGFAVKEIIGESYVGRVELVTDDEYADIDALDGAPCTLTISRGGGLVRKFHGFGQHTTLQEQTAAGQLLVSVEIVPALTFLDIGRNLRWFLDKTVPEILKEALVEGLGRYDRELEMRLYRERAKPGKPDQGYQVRETTAQYRETLYRFMRRLMEDEGITSFFDHSGEVEKLVLVDSNSGFRKLTEKPIQLNAKAGFVRTYEAVHRFSIGTNPTPRRVVLGDRDPTRSFDFVKSGKPEEVRQQGERPAPAIYPDEEDYQHPAGLVFGEVDGKMGQYKADDLDARTRIRFEAAQARARVGKGAGDVSGFCPGFTFALASQRHRFDGEYLITSVVHHGRADWSERTGRATEQQEDRYWNEFECVPLATQWRPERRTPRPSASCDRAIVMAPKGSDEIFTDKRGYVRVQFVGDRDDESPPAHRSAWLPVAQGWLGAGMGKRVIPRRGMEVVVMYEGSDPDRPIVIACAPSAENFLPYNLPDEKTRTVFFRTMSVPREEDATQSELSVDDTRGKEQLFLQAGRDLEKVVRHDERAHIKHDERRTVGNLQQVTVEGERKDTVVKDETRTVKGNHKQTVELDSERILKGNDRKTVTKDSVVAVHGDAGRTAEIVNLDKLIAGNRDATVHGNDDLHVEKTRTVTVDEQLVFHQGATTVECSQGHVDAKVAGYVRVRHAGAEVYIDDDGNISGTTDKEAKIQANGASAVLGNGKIAMQADQEISFSVGTSTIKLDATGVSTCGNNIKDTAVAMHQTCAPIITKN